MRELLLSPIVRHNSAFESGRKTWGGFVGSGLKSKLQLSILSASALVLSACSGSGGFETLRDTNTIDIPIVQKVTKENYMSGKEFCNHFINTGESETKEYGKWITVPYSYKEEIKEIQIYAFTLEPFNPNLPSLIFVDGGPGQNTHQLGGIVEKEYNEIHFDQRGVGCSAPENWEAYIDPKLYSSENTTRDIDEVRKAYGLSQVSVYGVSYGTVPATMYGHYFESNVKSIVLEGVLGKVENLGRYTHRVEKYNLVINGLNRAQRAAFDEIMQGSDDIKQYVLLYFLGAAGYRDGGYRGAKDLFAKRFFSEDGTPQDKEFRQAIKDIHSYENPYDRPQHPGAVDENVLIRFYCKELGGFSKDKFTMKYSPARGFFEETTKDKSSWAKDCADQNITEDMENQYDERNYTTRAPVYYFQGSHDGATLAEGALGHWKSVPQNKSYFLLSLKGGHNPALSKIKSDDKEVAKIHKNVFMSALSGQVIDFDVVAKLNESITKSTNEQVKKRNFNTWELFTSNKTDSTEIQREFSGLKNIRR